RTGALPPYGEKTSAEFICHRLAGRGLDTELQEFSPGRANALALLDVNAASTLILDAHCDTVGHENMRIPPFEPLVREGRLYGRGACDNKASLAVFMAALEEVLARGIKPARNLLLLACGDEEFSFAGLEEVQKRGLPKTEYALVGEPTRLQMLNQHKGVMRVFLRARGLSCHSCEPQRGRNAIYKLSEAILRLRDLAARMANERHGSPLGPASLNVGVCKGGEAPNVVPESAWAEIDIRLVPGMDSGTMMTELRTALDGLAELSLDPPHKDSPVFIQAEDSLPCRELQNAASLTHSEMGFCSASFATHAPLYQKVGIPAIVFGPGDIAQAHTDSEFVELAQVEKALDIVLHLICT
ncbi:MAG: M20/M25/M40 family metallo-hydrolase, partial [Planctomycetes bacterium]|nr:M20/M25/M40 family metallo-hydrolase [Planctomycetota bacterium]